MTWRAVGVGRRVLGSLLAASVLSSLQSGCNSDSGDVQFSDVPSANGRGGSSAAGTQGAGGLDSPGGGQASAGSSAGSGNQSGSTSGGSGPGGQAGTDAGGTASGGTDAGGTASGGTDAGGTASGGTGGSSAGLGGSAGTGGGGGAGGSSAGMGGGGGAGGVGGGGCAVRQEVCDGLDNNCDDLVDPKGTCPEGCVGAARGRQVYYFCGVANDASAAASQCAGFGMSLVAVNSAEENEFVRTRLATSTWTGGNDLAKEGVWRWLDGSQFWQGRANGTATPPGTFTAWLAAQPNDSMDEDCLVLLTGGAWYDDSCEHGGISSTCESAEPNDPGAN